MTKLEVMREKHKKFVVVILALVFSNIAFLIFEKNYQLKILQSIILIIVGIINFNRTYLNQFIFNRIEQSGDVDLLIVPNIEPSHFQLAPSDLKLELPKQFHHNSKLPERSVPDVRPPTPVL